jgi:hypothetical protein
MAIGMKLTAFTEKSRVLRPGCSTHFKNHILQTGSLSGRPVNSCSFTSSWDIPEIKDKMSHLSVEHIGDPQFKLDA